MEIQDGRKGIFDMKPCLAKGAFRELDDVHYFDQVGILTWPHEQDIAPETLLAELKPHAPPAAPAQPQTTGPVRPNR